MTTSAPPAPTTSKPWMSSAGGFPAPIFRWPVRAPASPARTRDSGASTPDSFASYDPATSSWRTSQRCLFEGWDECSETWPRAGMTRSGTAYPLRPLAPLTAVTDSGLWPTPTRVDGEHPGRVKHKPHQQFALSMAVQRWPTPRAADWKGAVSPTDCTARRVASGEANLCEAVQKSMRMWPTPTVQDASNNGGPSQYSRNSLPLNAAAGGALNPIFVEWLMGFPLGWTVLPGWGTRSSRRSLSSSPTVSSSPTESTEPLRDQA